MSDRLTDRTVVVTGSSTGIGEAAALRFAEEGASVVTNSRAQERAESTAEVIREAGGEAVAVEADMTDREEVGALVDAAVEEFGSLDVMVNNAGQIVHKPALEQTEAEWRRVIDVNLTGVFFGCQAAGAQMIEQGEGGQIINIASVYGSVAAQGRSSYNASKAGVINLTRCLAVELAEDDVHVNALSPGYFKTRMAEPAFGERAENAPPWPYYGYANEHIYNRVPLGRFGRMDELTNCMVFLAEGEHYMTGENMHADGGFLPFGWGSKGSP